MHTRAKRLTPDLLTVHLYGKGKATKGRKVGHLTVLGDTMAEAERDVKPLIAIADAIRNGTVIPQLSELRETKSKTQPVVGITTGSDSDQIKLTDCYKVLDDLAIPYEKRITSVGVFGALSSLPQHFFRLLLYSHLITSPSPVSAKADSERFYRPIAHHI